MRRFIKGEGFNGLSILHGREKEKRRKVFIGNPKERRRGLVIAQAVSRWLRARLRPCGILGSESGTGACFLRVLRFPLPMFIPAIAPQSPEAGMSTVGQLIVAVPSGLSLIPLITTKQ